MNFPNSMDSSGDNTQANEVAALHAEFLPLLRRLAWAILRDWELADDAVQETFVLFAQKIVSVDEKHRRGWLVKTVQFQAMNLRRSRQRNSKLVERIREQPTQYCSNQSKLENYSDAEKIDELRHAIESLPDEQRQIVLMRLVDDKGFAEIASELNLPLGTVLSRMRLATDKLRRKLTDHETE